MDSMNLKFTLKILNWEGLNNKSWLISKLFLSLHFLLIFLTDLCLWRKNV